MESSDGFVWAFFLALAIYVGWNVWREWEIPPPPPQEMQQLRNQTSGETCSKWKHLANNAGTFRVCIP